MAAQVAGIDSSTQSTKVVVCDAETGTVLREGRADHPAGSEVDPHAWWLALEEATAGGLLDGVEAISVAGQQHGMVACDDAGAVVRPALLWNDIRSAQAAADLVSELGAQAWVEAVGSVPVASFTVTKLRWLAQAEPDAAERVTSVCLPHDWLTGRLLGTGPVTDRGDASGTGYFSPGDGNYRQDLVKHAFGRELAVPPVIPIGRPAGRATVLARDAVVAGGTGDNMGAALGLELGSGDVTVSLGTSGTAFAVHDTAVADASGTVAGFADAVQGFLPLVATLNAARVLAATAKLLGVSLEGLDVLAMSAPPGADGLVLLPYLDGERTPNLPGATGTLAGLTRKAMTPANVARATVEGMLCGLADAVDALRANGVPVRRIILIGGAARSQAVRSILPSLLEVPVSVPEPAEYVALGAARQAAWTWSGCRPAWGVSGQELPGAAGGRVVRSAYATVRDRYAEALR